MVSISEPGQERARAILAVEVMLLVMPWPFLFMRLYARKLTRVKLCFNDWAVIAGAILAAGSSINLIVASISGGNGERIWDITESEGKVLAKTTYSAILLWPSANTAVRLSILHFYKTVFVHRSVTIASYVIAAMCLAFWVCEFVIGAVICMPVRSQWDKSVHGHCLDIPAYYLAGGIINLFLDISILILPQPVLWRLHMPVNRKIALSLIFGLGACTCIVSVFRCIAIGTESRADITYSEIGSAICSALEPTLGVIVACLPLLLPVLTKYKTTSFAVWVKRLSSRTSRINNEKLDLTPNSTNEPPRAPSATPARQTWCPFRRCILVTSTFTVSTNQDGNTIQSTHHNDPLDPGRDNRIPRDS